MYSKQKEIKNKKNSHFKKWTKKKNELSETKIRTVKMASSF